MKFPKKHRVTVVVDGKEVDGWTEYQIDVSMLEPADSFSLTMPFSRDAWNLCRTDRAVRVVVDRTTVVTGFIDSRKKSSSRRGSLITISGRDKAGRLVQESADSVTFQGLRMSSLFERLVAPWFDSVSLSNTRNRKVLRGKGVKVRSSDKVFLDSVLGSRIEPGCAKWEVIHDICEQAGCLAWSSGDGRELIVGQPNYDQDVQFRFVLTEERRNNRKCNVVESDVEDSVADRYSVITVVGSGSGDAGNYGVAPASRHGVVRDGPNDDGTGADFKYPKRLVVADRYGIKSRADAETRAKREAARRNMRRSVVTLTAPAHGQVLADSQEPTLFAPDLLVHYSDEEIGSSSVYLIVGCSYRSSRKSGETTTIEMLPKGTELTL